MAGFGYKPYEPPPGEPTEGPPAGARGRAGPGKTKGKGGRGGPPKKGGVRQPAGPRVISLISLPRSTLVADQPVTLTLTPEERAAIAEQLKGLDAADEIKEEDAKAARRHPEDRREGSQRTLETVGYRRAAAEGKAAGGPSTAQGWPQTRSRNGPRGAAEIADGAA